MQNDVQILFRTSKRLANQYDLAAQAAGLSRSQWIVGTLSQQLSTHPRGSLAPAVPQSALTTQLMLEAWLTSRVEPLAMQQVRKAAKVMMEKYYDA